MKNRAAAAASAFLISRDFAEGFVGVVNTVATPTGPTRSANDHDSRTASRQQRIRPFSDSGHVRGGVSTTRCSSDDSGDGEIDLGSAMKNARANLAAGTSPGAGLESAFDQADAAFADLIVTSIDDQGVTLDEEDVQELAKSGMMDKKSTSRKSKGLLGDVSDMFGALSGGAHIVKRDDGTV
ncbi:unnamed protein product [Scytosiphon promiscuus]